LFQQFVGSAGKSSAIRKGTYDSLARELFIHRIVCELNK
jgi:hypothetical protein